jgi:hypothetical protein
MSRDHDLRPDRIGASGGFGYLLGNTSFLSWNDKW